MTKIEREEYRHFYDKCTVNRYYNSNESSYYIVTHEGVSVRFCISTHHGSYRGKMTTVISRDKSMKKVRRIAWELWKEVRNNNISNEVKFKKRKSRK